MAIKTHSKHFIFINFSNFHRNFIQFSKLWIDSSFWCVFYNMYTWLRWLNQPTATRTNNQMLYENHAWFASSWIILIRFISWESKSHAQILQNMIAVRPIINQTEGFLRKPKQKRPSLDSFCRNLFRNIGYINVGDECGRQNVLVTTLGCWWPI